MVRNEPKGNVHFWPQDWLDELAANRSNHVDGMKEFCTSPEKFEYCEDKPCKWHFKDLRCLDLCGGGSSAMPSSGNASSHACLEQAERWVKEEWGMFFPTYFN